MLLRTKGVLAKIKPLIKWTGGKYKEFAEFKQFIPHFDQYIEPFLGGGGVFFALQSGKRSFLNDKSKDLISFYTNLNNAEFKHQSLLYADAWDKATLLNKDLLSLEKNLFSHYLSEKISSTELKDRLKDLFNGIDHSAYYPLFDAEFNLNPVSFINFLADSLAHKFKRIQRITKRELRVFINDELDAHFETGLKSGIYLYLRKLMNDDFSGKRKLSPAKAIANWYFVREFCYASMFRYNVKGGFNIPYGGTAYNYKNYRSKVEQLFSAEVKKLFKNASFSNLDFEDFLKTLTLSSSDFIFLDPPYDSEFSEYDQNTFTQHDQRRLCACLEKISAKWMMVIKETPFIRSLYEKEGIYILDFKKNYTYNVRGRNDRNTQHLIILNYDPQKVRTT
ncbi:MAG: DNA adenine methylase [Daejeonella sp.]